MAWSLSNAHRGSRRFVSSIRNFSSSAVHSACSSLARECISRSASAPEPLLMLITFQRTRHATTRRRNSGIKRAGDQEGGYYNLRAERPSPVTSTGFFRRDGSNNPDGFFVCIFSPTKKAGGYYSTKPKQKRHCTTTNATKQRPQHRSRRLRSKSCRRSKDVVFPLAETLAVFVSLFLSACPVLSTCPVSYTHLTLPTKA